jgi:putative transposase
MTSETFTQLYIHLVFAVKYREHVLHKGIRNRVYEYMSGIIRNQKHKSIIINGMPDHVHILLGLNPSVSISETVQFLKRNSSLFINSEKLCMGRFAWQPGYGAFSYSRSQLENVYHYIENQEIHHKMKSFREEYLEFLKRFQIKYDRKYLFEFFN